MRSLPAPPLGSAPAPGAPRVDLVQAGPPQVDQALALVEHRLRVRAGRVRVGTDAYFFQEGMAERYAGAAYGEYRVAADGAAVLTGLRDAEGRRLGASLSRP